MKIEMEKAIGKAIHLTIYKATVTFTDETEKYEIFGDTEEEATRHAERHFVDGEFERVESDEWFKEQGRLEYLFRAIKKGLI